MMCLSAMKYCSHETQALYDKAARPCGTWRWEWFKFRDFKAEGTSPEDHPPPVTFEGMILSGRPLASLQSWKPSRRTAVAGCSLWLTGTTQACCR